jgi:uncharacterized Zn finger protein (UPF0148 family)
MKTAIYNTLSSERIVVEYDEEAPCRICGKPVVEASMGGTDVCPWCDSGKHRDNTPWTYKDVQNRNTLRQYADEEKDLRERKNVS